MTVEEKAAMTKVTETLTFENGRYTIGIPWREGEPKLGNSYEAALVRLKSQEKALKRKGTIFPKCFYKLACGKKNAHIKGSCGEILIHRKSLTSMHEFKRLLFGNTASPFCSQYLLHTMHAQAHKAEYPEAAESVDNSMYIDDFFDSINQSIKNFI